LTPSPEDILTRATAPHGDLSILPRALLVFAHPDDETVALGARLGRFRSAHLVHVTDGAPRNEQDSQAQGFASLADYRVARAAEINRMIAMAGISQIGRDNLNFADQEASLHLAELTRTLQNLIGQLQPEAIYTHPY
jgi:N-acetylglucosamine malate deacetylase 2